MTLSHVIFDKQAKIVKTMFRYLYVTSSTTVITHASVGLNDCFSKTSISDNLYPGLLQVEFHQRSRIYYILAEKLGWHYYSLSIDGLKNQLTSLGEL